MLSNVVRTCTPGFVSLSVVTKAKNVNYYYRKYNKKIQNKPKHDNPSQS